ncbi:hypothetical protein [Cupriavidus yeoncheonensis]|nr:hypothetical protein [Cupriavidus yeoncheonensis]
MMAEDRIGGGLESADRKHIGHDRQEKRRAMHWFSEMLPRQCNAARAIPD